MTSRSWDILYRVIFVTCIAAMVASFWLGIYVITHPSGEIVGDLGKTPINQWPLLKKWEAGILIGWVVLPPLFFWLEYFAIYRRRRGYNPGDDHPADWEMFKYAQDVSAKVWIAVSTALLILYFGKDIKL